MAPKSSRQRRSGAEASLEDISPDEIKKNPDNPRMIFREEDMQALLESIRAVGIKVPLSVYRDRDHYVILDGERRWRCARKLNLATVPALVQPKPDKLENLLMMFNIHKVRVDWDIMPTAYKLGDVRQLLERSGQQTDVDSLAGLTGLTKSMVRTCLDLLELPQRYRDMLLEEAEKPKADQRITPDLFIEINKSRRVVERYAPEALADVSPTQYVDKMVSKYKKGVINNVVRFRDISKMARAEKAGSSREKMVPILKDLISDPSYRIEDAFQDSVQDAYEQRDLGTRIDALTKRLKAFRGPRDVPAALVKPLTVLRDRIDELLP
jgi:ParB family transcriptional regulator, chromosome partitioning protein